MAENRQVHARFRDDTGYMMEVVRYDRAGKWYIEPMGDLGDFTGTPKRRQVTIKQAVFEAARARNDRTSTVILYGRPGGSRFDKLVRERVG